MPRSQKVRLTRKQRLELAKIAGTDPAGAETALDQLEVLLDDHAFVTDTFESPKPNEVRRLLTKGTGMKRRLEQVVEAIEGLRWEVAAEFQARGIDLKKLQEEMLQLASVCDAIVAAWASKKTARRPSQRIRDRHTIPPIADLFDRLCGRTEPRRDWEHLDAQCKFVAVALKAADIPCPSAGTTSKSEASQGRLRRILKKRLHQKLARSKAEMLAAGWTD